MVLFPDTFPSVASVNTFNTSMAGQSISHFHTISLPNTKLYNQSYPNLGLHTDISTYSINLSTYSIPINGNATNYSRFDKYHDKPIIAQNIFSE